MDRRAKGFYQIGEVSKASGTPIPTIRYYEGLGLLEKPARSDGGFRLYSETDVQKLRFIRKAQNLGFSLKEIKTVMRESQKGLGSCCDHVQGLIKSKLSELDLKLLELKAMRSDLQAMLKQWIPVQEAKKKGFIICPQIESQRGSKRGGKRHDKKKG